MNHKEVNEYREDLRSRIVRMETILERLEKHLLKLNDRTAKLEGWKQWTVGGMASLGLLITLIRLGVL